MLVGMKYAKVYLKMDIQKFYWLNFTIEVPHYSVYVLLPHNAISQYNRSCNALKYEQYKLILSLWKM